MPPENIDLRTREGQAHQTATREAEALNAQMAKKRQQQEITKQISDAAKGIEQQISEAVARAIAPLEMRIAQLENPVIDENPARTAIRMESEAQIRTAKKK